MKEVEYLYFGGIDSQFGKKDYGLIDIIKDRSDGKKRVSSLTDHLLNNVFSGDSLDPLSPPNHANQSVNLLTYLLTNVTGAVMCYTPVILKDEQYAIPEIDINKMTSIGVALAMLILSTIQNEIMLDTQMEGIKGTQSQKLSASNTTVLKVQQQIRKARYKSGFQKFMAWLSSTCVMKFLNSQFGKIIMFVIGAAVTVASFGSAGPVVIAISSALLAFQAAELILGKSMGELLTQSMDDGAAKMALQMSIDISLMIADMAMGGADSAAKSTEMLENTTDTVQKAQKIVQQSVEAAEKVTKELGTMADIAKTADTVDDITKSIEHVKDIAGQMQDTLKNVQQVASEFESAVTSGADVAEVAARAKDLQKQMNQLTEHASSFAEQMTELGSKLDDVGDVGKYADMAEDINKSVASIKESLREFTQKNTELFKELFQKYVNVDDYIDPTVKTAEETEEKMKDVQHEIEQLKNLDVTQTDKLKKINNSVQEVQTMAQGLKEGLQNGTTIEDVEKTMNDITNKMKELNQQVDSLAETSEGIENVSDLLKDTTQKLTNSMENVETLKVMGIQDIHSSSKALNVVKDASRFLLGLKGLEHLDFAQQMISALKTLQRRIQMLMQFYQALYSFALSEEERRNIICAATIDAIRTKSDAQQEFYQMCIDNQMSDIQALMSYVKNSFGMAAEAIREHGETNRMIIQNITV